METMLIGANPAKVKSTHKSECFSAGINLAISRTYYHKIAYEINKKKERHIMDNYERALELVNKGAYLYQGTVGKDFDDDDIEIVG